MIGAMSTTTDGTERELIRIRLIDAGLRRSQGRAEAEKAMAEINADLRRGLKMDPPMSPAELAHLSGISRESVYVIKRQVEGRKIGPPT